MNGHFSEEALAALQAYYGLQQLEFSENGEIYDFTRCVRPNGTAYGTSGRCRKGTQSELEEKVKPGGGYKVGHLYDAAKKLGGKGAGARFDRIRKELAAELGVRNLADKSHLSELKRRVISEGLLPSELASMKPASARPASAKPPSAKPAAAKKRQPKKASGVTREELAELKAIKNSPSFQDNRKKYLDKEKELAAKDPKFREKVQADAQKRLAAAQKKVEAAQAAEARAYEARRAKGLRTRGPAETKAAAKRVEAEFEATFHQLRLKNLGEEPKKSEAESPEVRKARLTAAREERRELLKQQLKVQKGMFKDLLTVTHGIQTYRDMIKAAPELATPKNLAALKALRLIRMKMLAENKGERVARTKEMDDAVQNSPKYGKTPGSTKPLPDEGPEKKIARLKAREKQLHDEREKLYQKNPNDQYLYTLTQEIYKTERARASIEAGNTNFPLPLSDIYERQGFNAKPEMVATRSELAKRNDIIRHPNGEPIIMYRGVTTMEFADQFKGMGPHGDTHFAGQGIYGNGTYAAASLGKPNSEIYAQMTAQGYAGSGGDPKTRVTAMAFRKDAKIVTDFPGENYIEQQKSWNKWAAGVIKKANRETGMKFNDVGEAAAALGIHAYRVPQGSEDYWVILNRGAVIVAQDNEL